MRTQEAIRIHGKFFSQLSSAIYRPSQTLSSECALESVSDGLRLDSVDVAVNYELIKLGNRCVGNELHRRRLHRPDELRLEVLSSYGQGIRVVVDCVDADCRQIGVVNAHY